MNRFSLSCRALRTAALLVVLLGALAAFSSSPVVALQCTSVTSCSACIRNHPSFGLDCDWCAYDTSSTGAGVCRPFGQCSFASETAYRTTCPWSTRSVNSGAIAGGIIGGMCFLIGCLYLLRVYRRRRALQQLAGSGPVTTAVVVTQEPVVVGYMPPPVAMTTVSTGMTMVPMVAQPYVVQQQQQQPMVQQQQLPREVIVGFRWCTSQIVRLAYPPMTPMSVLRAALAGSPPSGAGGLLTPNDVRLYLAAQPAVEVDYNAPAMHFQEHAEGHTKEPMVLVYTTNMPNTLAQPQHQPMAMVQQPMMMVQQAQPMMMAQPQQYYAPPPQQY